jgi:hypothetical protein
MHSLSRFKTRFFQKEINEEGWALPVCSLAGKLESAKSKCIATLVPVVLFYINL